MELFERGFTTKFSSHLLIHAEKHHQNYKLTGTVRCTVGSLHMHQSIVWSWWSTQHRNRLEPVTVTFDCKTNRYTVLMSQLSVQAWLARVGSGRWHQNKQGLYLRLKLLISHYCFSQFMQTDFLFPSGLFYC